MSEMKNEKIEMLLAMSQVIEDKRKEFYEALIEGHVYTFGTMEVEEGADVANVTLRYFKSEDLWVLPIFTRVEHMQNMFAEEELENLSAITVRGKELFEMVDEDAVVVLNLGSDVSKTFSPTEIQDIVSGKIFRYYQH